MPLKDPEARRQYQKEYAAKHRMRIYENLKAWRKANPENGPNRTEDTQKTILTKLWRRSNGGGVKTQFWQRKFAGGLVRNMLGVS